MQYLEYELFACFLAIRQTAPQSGFKFTSSHYSSGFKPSWLESIFRLVKVKKKLKGHVIVLGKFTSELWDITCHKWSHSVTCS